MRFFAILAVLFGVTAGAVALGDPDARPVPRRLRVPLSSVHETEVFEVRSVLDDGSKDSGIWGVPIPSSAVRTHDDDCLEPCEQQTWTVGGATHEAILHWYADRLDGLAPWRGLTSCGEVFRMTEAEWEGYGDYRWVNEQTALDIQLHGDTILVREAIAGEMSCQ
jgi:hypothetical protein